MGLLREIAAIYNSHQARLSMAVGMVQATRAGAACDLIS